MKSVILELYSANVLPPMQHTTVIIEFFQSQQIFFSKISRGFYKQNLCTKICKNFTFLGVLGAVLGANLGKKITTVVAYNSNHVITVVAYNSYNLLPMQHTIAVQPIGGFFITTDVAYNNYHVITDVAYNVSVVTAVVAYIGSGGGGGGGDGGGASVGRQKTTFKCLVIDIPRALEFL